MKRFWVFVIICVVALGIGFTIFRFMSKEEILYLNQTVYEVNNGETFTLDIVKKDLKASTEITATIANTKIVERTDNPNEFKFKAVNGGSTEILISSNIKGFETKRVEVLVGDGTYATPYFIKSLEQLKKIGVEAQEGAEDAVTYPLSASYKLIANIKIDGEWTPIGANSENGFTGNFDFNGKTISNMSITSFNGASAGLFAKIGTNGYVKGANIVSSTISCASQNVGTLAGENYGAIEDGVVNKTNIANTIANAKVGGFVGKNSGTITKSQLFDGTINASGNGSAIGGFVGASVLDSITSNSAISRSSAEATLMTENADAVGGLIGLLTGSTIENCYSGSLEKDCIISGSQTTYIGGIAGVVSYSTFGASIIRSSVADTYTVMQYANSTQGKIGAIIGKNDNYNATLNNNIIYGNYYSTDVNTGYDAIQEEVNPATSEDHGVYGKTTQELKVQATYFSFKDTENVDQFWQFADGVWTMEANISLPKLSFETNFIKSRIPNFTSPTDVTSGNFVEKLSNADAQTTYILRENIYLSTDDGYRPFPFNGRLTCPVDEEGNPLYTINLTFKANENIVDGVAAVFTILGQNAELTNIKVSPAISNITEANHVAGLAGYNNGVVSNCYVANNTIKTDFADDSLYISGLIAENRGKILECVSNAQINYTKSPNTLYAGGITGYNSNLVDKSTNFGMLIINGSAKSGYVGGVVGYATSEVNTCANKAVISGEVEASGVYYGGVIGGVASNDDAKVKYCANYSNVTGSYVGGLVGISSGAIEFGYVGPSVVLSGKYVGGLANSIKKGYMKNSMTDSTNVDASGVGCGVVYLLDVTAGHNAYCEHIFSSCNFTGSGAKYYETASNIRGDSSGLPYVNIIEYHAFDNCIHVARSGGIKRQRFEKWISNFGVYHGLEDIEISDAQAKGNDGAYQVFRDNTFSSSIWIYDDTTKGSYIQLRGIAK